MGLMQNVEKMTVFLKISYENQLLILNEHVVDYNLKDFFVKICCVSFVTRYHRLLGLCASRVTGGYGNWA